jgi:hypothetical protein
MAMIASGGRVDAPMRVESAQAQSMASMRSVFGRSVLAGQSWQGSLGRAVLAGQSWQGSLGRAVFGKSLFGEARNGRSTIFNNC